MNGAAAFLLALVALPASAQSLPEVTQLRGLLLSAIESNRKVEAWVAGPLAQTLTSRIQAPAGTRVKVEIDTLSVIRPGCKRLSVAFTTPGFSMQTTAGGKEVFRVNYGVNLCSDGKPPQESAVGREIAP